MRVILATLGLCLACLGGCGQMGPLYMPADESAAAGEPAAGDPAAGDPAADAAAEGDDGAPATLEID
jgi:predicted small lipoprotein YifL